MTKRNGIISLWKFIFSITIILRHCYRLYPNNIVTISKLGYIGVEYFYIISGYFLAINIFNTKKKINFGKQTINYIWRFIKKLIPYIIIAYIFLITILFIFNDITISGIINSIWYPLLLRQFGFNTLNETNPLWYLTSYIISVMILYPLVLKYKKDFIYIASPLIVLFGLGYLNHQYGQTLDHSYQIWENFYYTSTLRALIEVNLGFIIYEISNKLKMLKFTNLGKILITIVSESFLIIVLLIILFSNIESIDYILLLLISISILLITLNQNLELKLLSNKVIFFLEKISVPMYINHVFIIIFISYLNINILPEIESLIIVLITIIFSSIELKIIEILNNKKILNKLTNLIIEN